VSLSPEIRFARAKSLYKQGQNAAAITEIQEIIVLLPRAPGAHLLLGSIYQSQMHFQAAEACCRKALEIDPRIVEAQHNLANCLRLQGRYDEAIEAYRECLTLSPNLLSAQRFLGRCLTDTNQTQEGISVLDGILRHEPNNLENRWQNARAMPIIYTHSKEINHYRTRYAKGLLEVAAALDLSSQESASHASDAIQDAFQLHYQGKNDRDLQDLLGQLIHTLQSSAHPEFSEASTTSAPQDGERIRVGFASSCFRDHTVAKLFGGWIAQLDRSRFEVFSYSLSLKFDSTSQRIKANSDHFYHFGMNIQAAMEQAKGDQLHVLIFPELGMDDLMLKMAALRIAPIQAVAWGHPVTTGLPTVDYFLSSALMEPEEGQEHYTEKLVKLPNLGTWIAPIHPSPPIRSRTDFNIPEDCVLYLSCQSLFKLLPKDDGTIVAIAEKNPRAHFAFISHPDKMVTKDFLNRIKAAFEKEGLNSLERLHILPRLNQDDYHCINQLADVFLDNPSWSGGMTTLEAIACGLVPVTLPGSLMRQRHSTAILNLMQVTETIAKNEEDYVDIAVRLGTDSKFRQSVNAQILKNRHLLFQDQQALSALESFLVRKTSQLLRESA
jgi:protein O-GlcNAc transferase